jgi:molybdenum cofactor biosynthesis enzyme MoaA
VLRQVNMVVIRGVNDDELVNFVRLGEETGCAIRFIELVCA